MNIKLALLSAFTLLYFLGGQWWYSNNIAVACCNATPTDLAPTADAAAAGLPLAFNWTEAEPMMGANFAQFKKENILKGMTADNILQITGLYYSEETDPEGFDNLGLDRAAAIRDLIQADIPIDRIDISSRSLGDQAETTEQAFAGVAFNWMAAPEKGETTIVEIDNAITIYFPFNSSVKDQNAKVDDYLKKLAERLQQTTEKVTITGHTDNVGEDVANIQLGKQRAASIRQILTQLGISETRILIDSKGERQPATSNDTEEGRHRNRRTVLNIIQ
ncbi:MAG: OmpA family protein [Bacteroidota bacterium]